MAMIKTKAPQIEILINNSKVEALLDTGASVSLICETIIPTNTVKACNKRVLDASGNYIPIKGEVKIKIKTPSGNFIETMLVYNKNTKIDVPVLFGMNVLRRAQINFPEGTVDF